MERTLALVSTLLVGLLFASVVYGQLAPSPPVWPLQWHADVIVGDAGLTPNAKSLSVLYEGQYFYNYSSSAMVSYYLTHRYSSRVEKEVIYADGSSTTAAVIDYSTGSCSFPLIIKDRWQLFTPNLITRNGFSFVGYDYLLNTEGDSLLETTHWKYSTLFGTSVEYWHATATNSPFRLSWIPVTGNPVIIQFSNFISTFSDIPNPAFYFDIPSRCNSNSNPQNHPQINSLIQNSNSFIQKRAAANPWPNQWNAAARFTGNAFGQQNLSPISIPFTLSGHFYYDYLNLRECNTWTDLSTASRSKTLIVNSTFYFVELSSNFCLIIPILPVSGPLKPEWPISVPYLETEWLYVKNTRAYIQASRYEVDALNIGERFAFNYWQSSNGTPRLFQGPVQDKEPYGVSLMEWEGVEMGLAGVDVESVFSVPGGCKKVGSMEEMRSVGGMAEEVARYYEMRMKYLH